MQLQNQTQGATNENSDAPALTRENSIAVFKVQQQIQMESMDEMMKGGMQEPSSQEGQMMMMMKMMVQQAKA